MRMLLLLLWTFPVFVNGGEPATVSGRLANFSDSNIVVYADKPYPQAQPEVQSFPLKANFDWIADLNRGTLITATANNQVLQLYLEPGDKLVMDFDPSTNPLSVDFSGTGAENNRFLQEFNKKFYNDFDPAAIRPAIETAASADAFEAQLFDQRLKQMRFVKEAAGKAGVTQGFRDFLNNQITYHYLGQLLNFSITKTDDPTGMKAAKLPDIMLSEMTSLPLSDERGMNSPAYRTFMSNYIRYHTSSQNSFVKFNDYADMLEREYSYALRYLTGEPFSYWLANELFTYCDKASPETVQKLHKALVQSDVSGSYVKPVSARCAAEISAKVVKKELVVERDPKEKGGSKSKDAARKNQPFTLLDLKGEKVYLEDFRGKVIYVDFWASWCGPCRQQFPYAKELHKMLSPEHLKQVLFLYISLDTDEATWKKAIEKNSIEGFNTLSPGGWSSSAAQHFGVHSIPRYMLIDKNGNIADANAKRPSSGQEIINDIVRLLKQ